MVAERRSRASQDLPARLSPELAAADLAQLQTAALLITATSGVVALEYSPEHGVPRLWLRAQGPHALELLSRAYSIDMPIVSDELLVAALSRLPLHAALPSEHHARVAEYLVACPAPAAPEVP
jgi:type III secretion system FlhB-like substrate exporter